MDITDLRSAINGFYKGLDNFINENEIKEKYNKALQYCQENGNNKKVRLIKGDLSGIQPFIYNVKQADDIGGNVAKRLRGRSFYVSAICHAVAEEIRLKFKLKKECILTVTGGKFFILAPDRKKFKTEFEKFCHEIDEWLWAKFWGAIYMNLAWSKPLSADDLNKNYIEIARKLQNQLELNKLNKFKSVIPNSYHKPFPNTRPKLTYRCHVFKAEYFRECHSCGQMPTLDDNIIKYEKIKENPDLCSECNEHQNLAIYTNLVENNRLELNTKPVNHYDIKFHKLDGILHETYDLQYQECPRIPAYVIQYDPDTKEEYLCRKCSLYQKEQRLPDKCQEDLRATKFHCLATAAEGAKKIGVVAGDMDHLSLITSAIAGLTLLDVMLLSQALQTFFCDYLIEKQLKGRPFYIVYSGGDDFLIVGSWNEVVKLAGEIREALHKFSNRKLSFSAGLIVTNPQDPIYESADIARQLLQQAKDHGRNRIKAMGVETGTMIDWKQYSKLIRIAEYLQKQIKDDSHSEGEITINFLFNFYDIYKLYRSWREKEDTKGLMYLPRLKAHLLRNLDPENKTQFKILKFFHRHLMDKTNEQVLPYFRFILDYIVLRQRN